MTICIAAIGNCKDLLNVDSEAIVIATDHMITLPQVGQFEHSIEKYKRINNNTVAMLSGEALLFEDVLEDVAENDGFDQIKKKLHENMVKIRDRRVDKLILSKFKMNHDDLKKLMMQPEHNDAADEMINAIKLFNLQTAVILAGFKDGKAHIAEISENLYINTRDINFNAIGSGGQQAINTLLFQRHSKEDNIKTTLYNVYKAKRNSEVSVGVGKETDLFILIERGKIFQIDQNYMKKLDKIYNDEMKFGKTHQEIDDIIQSLSDNHVRAK